MNSFETFKKLCNLPNEIIYNIYKFLPVENIGDIITNTYFLSLWNTVHRTTNNKLTKVLLDEFDPEVQKQLISYGMILDSSLIYTDIKYYYFYEKNNNTYIFSGIYRLIFKFNKPGLLSIAKVNDKYISHGEYNEYCNNGKLAVKCFYVNG